MQRVIALAGNATTIVNDLYSYTKELNSPGRHLNLPVVIAEREQLCERDAYLKAVEVHNELQHSFEAAAADLAEACPLPPCCASSGASPPGSTATTTGTAPTPTATACPTSGRERTYL